MNPRPSLGPIGLFLLVVAFLLMPLHRATAAPPDLDAITQASALQHASVTHLVAAVSLAKGLPTAVPVDVLGVLLLHQLTASVANLETPQRRWTVFTLAGLFGLRHTYDEELLRSVRLSGGGFQRQRLNC